MCFLNYACNFNLKLIFSNSQFTIFMLIFFITEMEVLRSNRLLEKYQFPDKSMFLYESGTGMIIEYLISFKFRET